MVLSHLIYLITHRPVMIMEVYDIVMLVVLLGAAIFGAVKGFAWQLASIASILVSYIVAYRFRGPLSQSIDAEPPWNQFLAMLILFVGTSLIIWVGFRMISNTIDRLKLREFDRQIGFLFGLAKGGLYCTLITLFAVTLMGESIRGKIVASKSGNFIARTLDRSESVIPPEIHRVLQPYLERFDERFQGGSQGEFSDGFPGGSFPGGSISGVPQGGFFDGNQAPDSGFSNLPDLPQNVSPQQLQNWVDSAAAPWPQNSANQPASQPYQPLSF